jgi:hypothetical protein
MKEYRVRANHYSQPEIPDAVIDSRDLTDLQRLAGIQSIGVGKLAEGSNISVTGNEKAELMKKNNIKPGTPEWFQLWFSLPYLTGEKPVDK